MSELKEMISEVVEKIFKENIEKETVDLLEENQWAENVWKILIDNELHNVAVSEANGGAGGDIEDLLTLYDLVGKYAAPVPFVEHTLANFLAEQFGITLQDGLATYSVTTALSINGDFVSGKLVRVPWAKYAKQIVTVASDDTQTYFIVVDVKDAQLTNGTNLAAEPRANVLFNHAKVLQKVPITVKQYEQITKLVTAASISKMNGALESAFHLSVQFSKERQQFGRPIHRFQLVQQHLGIMAGEQTLMSVATSNVQALLAEEIEQNEVAYARLRMDDASKAVATSAHQVHAAIGVTHEHRLHHFTRRLWAWRDEEFTARYWKKKLAEQMLKSNDDLWRNLTAQYEAHAHA